MRRSRTMNDRNEKKLTLNLQIINLNMFSHNKKVRSLSHGNFEKVKVGVTIISNKLPICPIASFPGGEMKVSCLPLHHHEEQ